MTQECDVHGYPPHFSAVSAAPLSGFCYRRDGGSFELTLYWVMRRQALACLRGWRLSP